MGLNGMGSLIKLLFDDVKVCIGFYGIGKKNATAKYVQKISNSWRSGPVSNIYSFFNLNVLYILSLYMRIKLEYFIHCHIPGWGNFYPQKSI
jgi:hypothetical protein